MAAISCTTALSSCCLLSSSAAKEASKPSRNSAGQQENMHHPVAALRHRPPLPSPHPTSSLLPIQMNYCMCLLSLHEVYMMVCKLLHFHGFYINLWLPVITLYGCACTYPSSNALTFQTIHLQHGCSSVKAVNSEPANTSAHRMPRKRSDGTNDTISLVNDSYLRLKTDLCGVYPVHMYIRTHTYTYIYIHTYVCIHAPLKHAQ